MRAKVSTSFNPFSRNLVRLRGSDAVAPARFTSRLEDSEAIYTLDVELDADGHSRCLRIEVEPADSVVTVPGTIDISRLLRSATAAAAGVAVYVGTTDGITTISAASPEEEAAAWERQAARRPKRRGDAPDYRRVAEVWEKSGGKIEAIHDVFGPIADSTAHRYVKKARTLGLLPAAASRPTQDPL